MKIILSLILHFGIVGAVYAQTDFVCEPFTVTGEIARGGAWLSFRTSDEKPLHEVKDITDSTFVVVDTTGRLLIADTLVSFGFKLLRNCYMVKNTSGKWAVYSEDFRELIGFTYDDLSFEMIEPGFTAMVRLGNKWGFVDSTESIVLPLEYDRINMLRKDVAILSRANRNYVFFLRTRKLVEMTDFCVRSAEELEDSNYIFIKKDNALGVMRNDGKVVVPLGYDNIRYVKPEDLLQQNNEDIFIVSSNQQHGLMTSGGRIVAPVKYSSIWPVGQVLKMNFGRIDYLTLFNGRDLMEEPIARFSGGGTRSGMAIVRKNNKAGLLRLADFSYSVQPGYQELEWFTDNAYCHARRKGRFGIIDTSGTVIVPLKYDEKVERVRVSQSNDKYMLRVNRNGLLGYLDPDDDYRTVLKPSYHLILAFSGGLARVMKNNRWGFIDEEFKVAIPLEYDYVESVKGERMRVVKNGKTYFINKEGNCVEGCNK